MVWIDFMDVGFLGGLGICGESKIRLLYPPETEIGEGEEGGFHFKGVPLGGEFRKGRRAGL